MLLLLQGSEIMRGGETPVHCGGDVTHLCAGERQNDRARKMWYCVATARACEERQAANGTGGRAEVGILLDDLFSCGNELWRRNHNNKWNEVR